MLRAFWAIVAFVILALHSSVLLSQTAPAQKPPSKRRSPESTHDFLGLGTPPDPEAAERGGKLYAGNCTFCHGEKATGGDSGPDLVRSTLVLHDEKGSLIGPVIHQGRPTRGMPAFASFTPAQLKDIAEFLHMRVELVANRGTYKIGEIVTGNAAEGERFFNGEGGCKACHSPSGDLAHIASRLSPPDLQQAFLYPDSRYSADRPAPRVKILLPSGSELSGDLRAIDDFNVTLVDAQGVFHSIARTPQTRVEIEDRMAEHRRLLDKYTDTDMHNLTAYLVTLK